ncbi:MAG: hypothetical protein IJH32_07785 [Ruminococcus sp.]|nr:hypothetical protein [Ruminococcus sp.]
MKTIERILSEFKPDEPILVEDIIRMFPDRSRQWVDNMLSNMTTSKQMIRYSTGVYFIPSTIRRGSSNLNPYKVIERKYIKDENSVYGYYGGEWLLWKMGIIPRHSEVMTIVSNHEKSRGRRVKVGKVDLYVSKAPTEINKENQRVLQLLEVIRLVDVNELPDMERNRLVNYILDHKITITDVRQYCEYFPDVVSKRILTGYVFDFLQSNANHY